MTFSYALLPTKCSQSEHKISVRFTGNGILRTKTSVNSVFGSKRSKMYLLNVPGNRFTRLFDILFNVFGFAVDSFNFPGSHFSFVFAIAGRVTRRASSVFFSQKVLNCFVSSNVVLVVDVMYKYYTYTRTQVLSIYKK